MHFRRHHSPGPVAAGPDRVGGREARQHPSPACADSADPAGDASAIGVFSSRRSVYTTPITMRTSLEGPWPQRDVGGKGRAMISDRTLRKNCLHILFIPTVELGWPRSSSQVAENRRSVCADGFPRRTRWRRGFGGRVSAALAPGQARLLTEPNLQSPVLAPAFLAGSR